MRDVEKLAPGTDAAYVKEGPGQIPAASTQTDPAYGVADKANTMPGLGGELGVARQKMISGPSDGGQAALAADPVLNPPAAPVVKPAYAMTGRSINPATPKRLYPWLNTPPKGLNTGYESNIANPGMMAAEAPAVAMGAVAEGPGDEDEDGGTDEEFEEASPESSDEKPSLAKRARSVLKRKK